MNTRVLAKEADLPRALVASLTAEQRRQAVAYVPWDIETGNVLDALNQRHPPILERRGIPHEKLSPSKRDTLEEIVRVYAHTQLPSVAEERLDKIKRAGWEKVRFLWMGAPEEGGAQSYRIVLDRVFLVEYNNQSFNQPDHEHTVWRDLEDNGGRLSLADRAVDLIRAPLRHVRPPHRRPPTGGTAPAHARPCRRRVTAARVAVARGFARPPSSRPARHGAPLSPASAQACTWARGQSLPPACSSVRVSGNTRST